MAKSQKAAVAADVCTGCGVCVDSCPEQAIELVDDVAKVKADLCNGCGACVDICPVEAIKLK
jgi:electron transfer flavoprotein alpha subunit